MHPNYEEVDHTADWAVLVRGKTVSDLLVHAAEAVLDLTGTLLASGRSRRRVVSLDAPDRETLLVIWLEDLLHAIESRRVGYRQMHVEAVPGWHLRGEVSETRVLAVARPIKAVTFHRLAILETPSGLETQVVFDV